jgi:hypothetical protein
MDRLQRRRRELIEQIDGIERLRRGQLSEQYIEKPGRDGKLKRYGPYYVWQASLKGQKRSVRVGRDNAEQVREDLAAYQQYRKLCEELADVTEQITCRVERGADSKKNSRKLARRSPKN